MKHLKTYTGLNDDQKGAAVSIGNFDGVHLGHQSVLALTRVAAAELNAPQAVMTFEPHPRSYFAPDAPAFRLMNATAKAQRLNRLGVDILYELPFNKDFAALSADDFISEVLIKGLGVRHVTVGADFCFGKGRSGDPKLLKAAGGEFGFGVTTVPLVSDDQGDFSSTAIRECLSAGKPLEASRMLGHWHRLEGRVEHGDKRGRTLGYPTANMALDGLHLPKFGIYAVLIDIETGAHKGRYRGAASLGVRPTFDKEIPNLETYIFDFDGDIYGEQISVALVDFLRPEAKFENVDELIVQMNADCDAARQKLASTFG